MTVEAYIPKHKYIATTLQSSNIDIDLSTAKVLELYGNAGTLLNDPENEVLPGNYTVFENDAEALAQGIEDFPDADFREWNQHNQMNNPGGIIDAPLPFVGEEKFDLIISYMKTANVDPEILEDMLTKCYEHLNPGGVIMFGVFIREVSLNYFVVRRTHEYGMLDEALIETTESADYFCLINNDDIRPHIRRVPTEGDDGVLEATHYTWFWNTDYMDGYLKELFPDATIGTRRLPPMWSIQTPFTIQKNS